MKPPSRFELPCGHSEPTIEETSHASGTCMDETRRVLAMSRYPISLDRPVGNSEDSQFGDLLPDGAARSPAVGAVPAGG